MLVVVLRLPPLLDGCCVLVSLFRRMTTLPVEGMDVVDVEDDVCNGVVVLDGSLAVVLSLLLSCLGIIETKLSFMGSPNSGGLQPPAI